MKKSSFLFLCFISSCLVPSLFATDDPQNHLDKILKEREANLQDQVQMIKGMLDAGMSGVEMELIDAKIALLAYQKEQAKTLRDQIKIQSEIVSLSEIATELMKKGVKNGVAAHTEFLKMKGHELVAKQRLAELLLEQSKLK